MDPALRKIMRPPRRENWSHMLEENQKLKLCSRQREQSTVFSAVEKASERRTGFGWRMLTANFSERCSDGVMGSRAQQEWVQVWS